jgi:hypothetical protein
MAKQKLDAGSGGPMYARAVDKLKNALRGNSAAAVSMAVVDDEEGQPLIIEEDKDAPFYLARSTYPLPPELPGEEPDAAPIRDIRDLDQARALVLIGRAARRYQLAMNPNSPPVPLSQWNCSKLQGFCFLATSELERFLKAHISRSNVIKAVYVKPNTRADGTEHFFVVMGRESGRAGIAVMSEPVLVVDITWAQFTRVTSTRIPDFRPHVLRGTLGEIRESAAFKGSMEKETGKTLLKRYAVGLWALTDPAYQCW